MCIIPEIRDGVPHVVREAHFIKDFEDARQACASDGGKLVMPKSEEELLYLDAM